MTPNNFALLLNRVLRLHQGLRVAKLSLVVLFYTRAFYHYTKFSVVYYLRNPIRICRRLLVAYFHPASGLDWKKD